MQLREIVSKAYQIFDYPKPNKIKNVCTDYCCLCESEASRLISLATCEISVELINEYNDGAQAVHYDMAEFKYFLPRYLDLISKGYFPSAIDISLSLKNLNFKDTSLWQNQNEKEIITIFSLTFFQEYLQSNSCYKSQNLIDIINMFYAAGIPIESMLELWTEHLNTIAIMTVENLVINELNFRKSKIIGNFITAEFSTIILDWLKNNKKSILEAVEYHIFNNTLPDKDLQKLSFMYDYLRIANISTYI